MDDLVFSQKEQDILDMLGIEALILFGSQARRTAGPMSDFDIGVLLRPKAMFHSARRKELYDALYDLLSARINRLVNIDIVFLVQAPMELQAHAAKYGIPVYEKNSRAFARFRERVMEYDADFAPLKHIFHNAILSRIPS